MFLSFTFNLAAQQLQPQAHPSRSGPLWVNPDKTGQQRLHGPQFRSVIIAVAFKYLAGKRARVIKSSIDCYSPPKCRYPTAKLLLRSENGYRGLVVLGRWTDEK